MAQKSKVLVVGGTGYIGKFIVNASAKAGHPTFVLVKESSLSHPHKSNLIQSFKSSESPFYMLGDISDHSSLVKALKQVDVVISAVSGAQTEDQLNIISAIKEAGNIKRFLPSEFGLDVDRHNAVEPAASALAGKAKIRRAIEAEGIPHTCVVSNAFAGYFLSTLGQQGVTSPPRDKVAILGDGNVKESPFPVSLLLSLSHSALVKGDCTNFEIEPSFGVEASQLYPEVKYTTVDTYLNQFV
ncbi:uncharacterized protein DS421_15g492190 [Arachis hypogaea]|nr:uncharacterized protein DS421_15g492190 [Arachis hypogaea]